MHGVEHILMRGGGRHCDASLREEVFFNKQGRGALSLYYSMVIFHFLVVVDTFYCYFVQHVLNSWNRLGLLSS